MDENFFLGIIADNLVRNNVMTLTTARKLFNSLTSFIPVLCMISFYFCDHSKRLLGIATVLVYLAGSGKSDRAKKDFLLCLFDVILMK